MVSPRKASSTARIEEARALERARDLPNARTSDDTETLKRAFAEFQEDNVTDWAAALRAMAARGAELLIPGHGVPVFGAERVHAALTDTAEWLEVLVRETLARMNAGLPLATILAEVRPPARLAERPYLQPVYDEPEFVVRNIWRLYGGWWDGVAAHLKPADDEAVGREIAALAGGVDRLVMRARVLAAAGDLPLASHLADWAVAASPRDRGAHAARAAIYEARAAASAALMTRGIFAAAARDSRALAD